ncbi:hypothetical protein OG311_01070 [Streptomyces sp. NBC_01343]|uniref:hypothetical protein n=1 Tax=Streptomyces sp. NBC_01343 TaxID=2903832 RepID=UPI002E13400C|nr:hypothetical protein OG311_01070 [Streptomyces sp. NBC_01343]
MGEVDFDVVRAAGHGFFEGGLKNRAGHQVDLSGDGDHRFAARRARLGPELCGAGQMPDPRVIAHFSTMPPDRCPHVRSVDRASRGRLAVRRAA